MSYTGHSIFLFALVRCHGFHIPQFEGKLGLGKVLEGIFTGWLESFQPVVAEMVYGAAPILQAILVDGIIGGVAAVMLMFAIVVIGMICKTDHQMKDEYVLCSN